MKIGNTLVVTKDVPSLNLKVGRRMVIVGFTSRGEPKVYVEHYDDNYQLFSNEYRLISPLELLAECAE